MKRHSVVSNHSEDERDLKFLHQKESIKVESIPGSIKDGDIRLSSKDFDLDLRKIGAAERFLR
jgi:hypothetical protein